MSQMLIGQIAGLIAIVQIIPYVVSIFKGDTHPERATYMIWSAINIVTVASYIAVGATTTIWTTLMFTFTGLLVLGLSFKYGVGGLSKFDLGCMALAVGGIILWITTKDALLTLYFNVFILSLGYLPTLKKVYFHPQTENKLSWIMATLASVLNIFALSTLDPAIALLPLSSALADMLVVYLLLYPAGHPHTQKHKVHHGIHYLLSRPILIKF